MTGADVARLARAWIGTPYVVGAAVRGAGCDCVGLIRGLLREVTGAEPPPPPGFRTDWAHAPGLPLLAAARAHLVEVPRERAGPGHVLAFRLRGRLMHAGVLVAPARLVHAVEGAGVAEVPLAAHLARPAFVFAFPEMES